MERRNHQFWIFYTAAWIIYSVCLGGVFLGVGTKLGWSLLLAIACNVAPVVLLGLLVFRICERLKWQSRRRAAFLLIHFAGVILFTVSWCFLTWLFLTVVVYVQRAEWTFVRWDYFATLWQLFSGVMVYLTIASAVYVRQMTESLRVEERRNSELRMRAVRAEAARASAELAALRAQLNPHFLFNTLHSLMALVRTDAGTAEEAIERFALMLRYVLRSQDEKRSNNADVSFADEWDFVQNYLEMERLRLGDRLQTITAIETAALDYRMPAFSLQPIIENAVKYAVAPRAAGGRIQISARSVDGALLIKVCDDGTGVLDDEQNQNGMGLRLVRESLATRFGAAASLSAVHLPNSGFEVTIKIPRYDFSGRDSVISTDVSTNR